MADKSFDRFRKFNFRIFKNLPQKGKAGFVKFYGCFLGACKKYNPLRYYRRKSK
ncbi:MAG: hypothetical protein PHF44_02880 [Candidatus Pacebacteria bacterium]|nr:hypothetical protein [Candidatus Paceibacterota bacterium]